MIRFVYLTSSSYSGSTLLAFLMAVHPQIATIGELGAALENNRPEDYKCSCGEFIRHCAFWNQVFNRMRTLHPDFSYQNSGTHLIPMGNGLFHRLQFGNLRSNLISNVRDYVYNRIPACSNHVRSIVNRNLDLAKIILDITNKEVFFDTSKIPSKIKLLNEHPECDLKVVHLIKDGRGVFDSIKRYTPENSDAKAINTWKKVNKFAERAMRYVDRKDRYRLLYKDLATNPAKELEKLCGFIGVDYTPECLDFRQGNHHILGNTKMRLGSINSIYYDEKWRKSLTSEQLSLFEKMAGKMNRRYGCV